MADHRVQVKKFPFPNRDSPRDESPRCSLRLRRCGTGSSGDYDGCFNYDNCSGGYDSRSSYDSRPSYDSCSGGYDSRPSYNSRSSYNSCSGARRGQSGVYLCRSGGGCWLDLGS